MTTSKEPPAKQAARAAETPNSAPTPAKSLRQQLEELGLKVSPSSGTSYVIGMPGPPATELTEAEAFQKHRERQRMPLVPFKR